MRAVWVGTLVAAAIAVAAVLVIATRGSAPRLEAMPIHTSLEHNHGGVGVRVHPRPGHGRPE